MSTGKIDLATFLNQQYLCESLTIKEVKTLLEYTELVTFNKDEIIADIGDVGEALYFVVKGRAALYYEEGGKEAEVGHMKEGEMIGEMSFFDRQPRSVRMRAMSMDTQLLKLPRVMYERLRVEHPYIAVNLLEHAIISLDHLFRRVSSDVATFTSYFFSPGKK
jgi:CRP/FNR family cyclic AMP-dependent transcriptional regulator